MAKLAWNRLWNQAAYNPTQTYAKRFQKSPATPLISKFTKFQDEFKDRLEKPINSRFLDFQRSWGKE